MMGDVVSVDFSVPRRLSRDQFKEEVVSLVKESKFYVLRHLQRDHPERRISHAAIENCLIHGTVQVDPFVNQYGNWQSELYRHRAGEEMTVVVAIEWAQRVLVITAY